jgi:type III restriction enzyme
LAPNLTIYNKLIADFTPNTPKYVFKGIDEFATNVPRVITGDNYDQRNPTAGLFVEVRINISKINTEVRGGSTPRIKKLSEYSCFSGGFSNFLIQTLLTKPTEIITKSVHIIFLKS